MLAIRAIGWQVSGAEETLDVRDLAASPGALWVAASFGLLVSGAVQPTMLGYAFVIAQALAVALLAGLQFIGLLRVTATA